MTMKYTRKVNYANRNNTTLKVVVPSDVTTALDLNANDTIKWIIKKEDDKSIVTIEKLLL